ncbi:rhomboid family intramembrane serine protease [Bacteroides sp. OttesenSCG-928-E20]|nr:rhomboid family intramembrane serine protease [Bacteroides sp. OttesenSCG-928-N06]MDL2299275.1 rhomboid family intramembrane serine protease [Bacteroides sp. OttesenSCG-928-E20]
MTYIIIGITVVVSYMCFGNREWFEKLAFVPYYTAKRKEWYRLITHGFVHADTMHLLINMFTFWSFGAYMEQFFKMLGYGSFTFLILYFGGMIVASLHDLIKRKDNPYYISVGASGAVSAILFSSIFFDPWGKILLFAVIPIPGIVFGVLYLAYCQYMARKGVDNINHNAHFYGAVFGFLFPLLLDPSFIHVFLENF